MRQDEFRREIIIDYICKLSGERVNPLPLFNEKFFHIYLLSPRYAVRTAYILILLLDR